MNSKLATIPELIARLLPKCVPFSCRYSASKLRTWPDATYADAFHPGIFTNSRRCDVRLQVPGPV